MTTPAPVSPGPTSDALVRHEALRSALESRRSIPDLAQAFTAGCIAFIAGGLALKLFRDSERAPQVAWLLAVLGAGLAVASFALALRGRRRMQEEWADFEKLRALRTELGLSSKLPVDGEAP